ncbi:tetratricopeptide repeat-containing sensor histidine kinase [Tenacibaculum jejuense]|uniref:Sensor histidine kinase n=1 Tax=Tenacibaculum jejuense TaxID=584609 RepID=A0A238UEQ7_9FLAO|nr:tetratricopeptide repeat protein [Tenacibaculum jejuense]SNR17641.1 Sensor histidine kinase [Tenacibaculum jejuense]
MENRLVILAILFLNSLVFSQNTNKTDLKTIFNQIVDNKYENYFKLDSILEKNRELNTIPQEEFYKLYENSLKKDYKIGQIYAYNNIGKVFRLQSKYEKAIEYHIKALKLVNTIKNNDVKAYTLNLLGSCYRRLDDIKNALNCHQDALTLTKRVKKETLINKRNKSISVNNIGNIYLLLKQYDLALQKFETSISISKELNNKLGLAINYQNMGFSQENLGFYDDAIENYYNSLKINKELNSERGQIICYNSLASTNLKKLEFEKALELMEKIYPLAVEKNNKFYLARTLTNLGIANLKTNHLEDAEKYLTESVKLSSENNFNRSNTRSLFALSELYEKQKEEKKAYEYYKKAVALEKKTINEKTFSYVNNLISKQNILAKINERDNMEKQFQIQDLRTEQDRNILIITLVTIALSSIALYSVYRQKLLNNDRKILLLEQQALQTQMNPHFIFNALNSIKLYVINNDQKQAVYYLNKFSKLIRNILEVSKVKEVSLKEELSTMDLYMTIENIRFSNEIDYTLNINPDLNTDTIKVPPLVLQPFLENAIWHGLSSKEGNKKITLTANKVSEDVVSVNIIDNGIGREAAGEIKRSKSLKRKSVGIDLTIERLKTFAEDYEEEFTLTYHDLTDDFGKPAGTKVSIQFPVV